MCWYRCNKVMKDPRDIGCRQGDVFCKDCIKECFNNEYSNAIKCPKCNQQNMRKSRIKSNKFVKQLIDNLWVKCQFCGKNNLKIKNLINHHKICLQRPQKCEYCQIEMTAKYMKNHSCDLKIFKTQPLDGFIAQNRYKTDIAKGIKYYFDTHCNGPFMVTVNGPHDDITHELSYIKPFKRRETIGNFTISIYKQPHPNNGNNNNNNGLSMDTTEFTKFCEGLFIGVDYDIIIAKQKLEETFGGSFFIGKGLMGIACKEYQYSCFIVHSKGMYYIIRISDQAYKL